MVLVQVRHPVVEVRPHDVLCAAEVLRRSTVERRFVSYCQIRDMTS